MIEIKIDEVFAKPLTEEEIAKVNAEQARQEALAYLVSTDWYIVRFMDSGVEVPQDVKDKRVEARLLV